MTIKQFFMIDRRIFKHLDWVTLLIALVLSTIGILTIYSATRPILGAPQELYYQKQFYWMGISLIFLLFSLNIDYTLLKRYAYPIFITGVILLALVLIVGKKGMGAQRWIPLGFVSFQPSEFFKIFFIIAFSRYLSDLDSESDLNFIELLKPAIVFLLIPMALIIKQPDLGTALMLLFVFGAVILIFGIKKQVLILMITISLISFFFIKDIVWYGLKDYQKNRIKILFDPDIDRQGLGYQIRQSKITIGSGGLKGKGYLKGTQGPLRFLPEKHTDFIFPIFAEEWGFFGTFSLFFLYFALLLRGLDTAVKARDTFGKLLAFGVTSMLFFYFTINIGMTVGMMPVVGVPLPFMSYGGTSFLTNYLAVSILINIRSRRFPIGVKLSTTSP
jgi:rod shape determining protein RodA